MKKNNLNNYLYQDISYYLFILLTVLVSLGFWKEFDNGFDLVKSSILKLAGGLFIGLSSLNYFSKSLTKSNINTFRFWGTLDIPMLFFLISVILSTIFSANIYLSVFGNYETQIGLITFLILFIIYFLLPSVISGEKRFKKTIMVFEVMALIVSVFSIIEYFGVNPFNLKPQDFIRPVTPVGHPVFSAGFITILLPFAAANISGKKSIILKVLVPIVLILGIIATQTRSAYLALAVQLVIFVSLYPFVFKSGKAETRKYIRISVYTLLFLFISVLILVITFPENQFVKRFTSISTITHLPRWFLWIDSLEMFINYPITGTGISAFSNVFENFASYQLKFAEIYGFFVNAHSNILNTFCTMGLIGGVSYLFIIIQVLRISFRNIFSGNINISVKNYFYAVIASVAGYVVFGIADFDDITIMLIFFVVLSLFKFKCLKTYKAAPEKNITINPFIKRVIGVLLIVFSAFSIYNGVNDLAAQSIFSQSKKLYSKGSIENYLNEMKTAIEMKPNESFYRYNLSYNILVYCSMNENIPGQTRESLLRLAKDEAAKAEENYRSRLECLALRSLIELELGNETEGFRLKDEIFKTDTTQFPYRTNLAVYYFKKNNDEAAIYEINSILNWDIKNIRVMTLKVYWFERKGLNDEAITECRKILEIEPVNQYALQTIERLNRE